MCRVRVGMEEAVGVVGTAPAIPRDLSSSWECWIWEAEEEKRSLRKKGKEGCPAVMTHVCLIPETRDAEGLQQVAATEQ